MFNSKFKKLKVALAVAAMAGSFAGFGGPATDSSVSPRMLLKSTPSAKNKK